MIIYGIHAATEALLNPKRKINYVYVTENSEKKLKKLLLNTEIERNLKVIKTTSKKLDEKVGYGAVHQGIVIEAESIPTKLFDDFLNDCSNNEIIIILDQLIDPENVGGIMRLARAFDVKNIIMSNDSSCKDETPHVIKSASGAFEHVNRIKVTNITQTLKKLKKNGFWILCLMECGEHKFSTIDLSGKIALIVGSEGSGVRRLVKEESDFRISIETSKKFSTLNAKTAAAIALYEIFKKKSECLF